MFYRWEAIEGQPGIMPRPLDAKFRVSSLAQGDGARVLTVGWREEVQTPPQGTEIQSNSERPGAWYDSLGTAGGAQAQMITLVSLHL